MNKVCHFPDTFFNSKSSEGNSYDTERKKYSWIFSEKPKVNKNIFSLKKNPQKTKTQLNNTKKLKLIEDHLSFSVNKIMP